MKSSGFQVFVRRNSFFSLIFAALIFIIIVFVFVGENFPPRKQQHQGHHQQQQQQQQKEEESRELAIGTIKDRKSGAKNPGCKVNRKPVLPRYEGPVDTRVTLTYSDPATYVGPIVEGWPPNASRNFTPYVRPTENSVLLEPKNLGSDSRWCESTRILIFQHSRPGSFANRLDNRRTWMNYIREYRHIKAIFVVGIPSGEKSDLIQSRIEREHELYGDILQVDYVEHANNNTLKTLHAFKYILNMNWQNKTFPEYVMKADDDIYINLPMLSRILFDDEIPKSKDGKIPLRGYVFNFMPVMTVPPDRFNLTYTDYIICPSYMYNLTSYPSYISGTGYVVPWWALSCLYQESLNLPYFHIEDVFIGAFAADRCYLPKDMLPGFSALGRDAEGSEFDKDLLIHYVNHDNKHNIHRKITEGHNKALDVRK